MRSGIGFTAKRTAQSDSHVAASDNARSTSMRPGKNIRLHSVAAEM